MFRDLPRYGSYKVAGEWVVEVPRSWGWEPARTIFSERKDAGHVEEQMLSVTIGRGVIPQTDLLSSTSKKDSSNVDKSKYKLVGPGDVVYNKMRAWQGAAGGSNYRGIVSPAYVVMSPREALTEYMHYVVRTPQFAKEAERWSYGITSDQWSLRPEHFKMIRFPLPPIEEQAAIVKYLAHANARIDKAITTKLRLIALLEEQSVLVSRQVLSGRSIESVDLDSGDRVPWLGRTPAAWGALPLKRLAKLRGGAGFPVARQGVLNQELPFFRVSDMGYPGNEVFLDYCESTVSRDESAELGAVIFEPESICFPKVGGALLTNKRRILKRSSCLDNNLMGATFFGLEVDYAYEIMKLVDMSDVAKPGPVPAVGQGDVGRIVLPVPPKEVQHALVEALRLSQQESARAANVAAREIDLLREFRTRLVADVVTGQVDVRAIAATLPDAPESFDITASATDDDLEEALREGEE